MREETSAQTRLASRKQRLRDKDGVSAVIDCVTARVVGAERCQNSLLSVFSNGLKR